MKIVVLGAGVIGVTSAYYLMRAGHEVTVVERRAAASLETSFANAGEISPGYPSPWPAPGIPAKALKWLFMHHAPLIVRPQLDWDMARWVIGMLRNCTPARYARNKSRMVPLAEYSRDELRLLGDRLGLQYDQRSRGTLQLFRTQRQLDGSAKDIAVLSSYGVPYEFLDRAGCVRATNRELEQSANKIPAACGCLMTTRGIVTSLPVIWLHGWKRTAFTFATMFAPKA